MEDLAQTPAQPRAPSNRYQGAKTLAVAMDRQGPTAIPYRCASRALRPKLDLLRAVVDTEEAVRNQAVFDVPLTERHGVRMTAVQYDG